MNWLGGQMNISSSSSVHLPFSRCCLLPLLPLIPSTREGSLIFIPHSGSLFPETGLAYTKRYHTLPHEAIEPFAAYGIGLEKWGYVILDEVFLSSLSDRVHGAIW